MHDHLKVNFILSFKDHLMSNYLSTDVMSSLVIISITGYSIFKNQYTNQFRLSSIISSAVITQLSFGEIFICMCFSLLFKSCLLVDVIEISLKFAEYVLVLGKE